MTKKTYAKAAAMKRQPLTAVTALKPVSKNISQQ